MTIVTQDQGSLNFGGGSQPRTPDTYTGLSGSASSGNAEALVAALGNLSGSMARREQRQEQKTEQNDEMLLRTTVDSFERDKQTGLNDLAIKGKLPATMSPRLVGMAQQEIGKRQFASEYTTTLPSLLADPNYQNNPQALAAWEQSERQRIYESTADSPMKRAGALQAFDAAYGNLKGQLTQTQSQAILDANKADFLDNASPASAKVKNYALEAARQVGIPPTYIAYLVNTENKSGQEDIVTSVKGATAAGLTQITDGTWSHLVEKYGTQYGLTMENRNDGQKNAIAAALYAKENGDFFKSYAGKEPTLDVFMGSHFLGPGGYKKVYEADPSTPINKVITGDAYSNNTSRFVKKDGSVMTVKEFQADLANRVDSDDFSTDYTHRYDGLPKFDMTRDSFASKNYQWTDLKNNGEYGGDGEIDGRLVRMLDDVTDRFGRKLKLTSAFRSADYNSKASYTKDSQHSHGTAIDIDVSGMNDKERENLVALFTAHGAKGMGHYDNGTIHVDLRDSKGKQSDGMALWYHNANGTQDHTAANPWFAAGVENGRKMRDTDTVPIPTHNNTPQNGFQLSVYDGVRRGYTAKQATTELFNHYLQIGTDTRDVSVLDQIPVELLNVEQQAKLYSQRQQIVDIKNTENVNRVRTTELNRVAAEKSQQDAIMEALANGQTIDALKMAKVSFTDADGNQKEVVSADVFKFAQGLSTDFVDPETSVVNAENFNELMQESVLTGDFTRLNKEFLKTDSNKMPSNRELRDFIASSDLFNSEQSKSLITGLAQNQQVGELLDEQTFNRATRDLQKTFTTKSFMVETFRTMDPKAQPILDNIKLESIERFRTEYHDQIVAHLKSQDELGPLTEIKKREYMKAAQAEAKALYNENMTELQNMLKEKVPADRMALNEDGMISDTSQTVDPSSALPQPVSTAIPTGTEVTFDIGNGPQTATVSEMVDGVVFVKDADGLNITVDLNQITSDISAYTGTPAADPGETMDIPGVSLTDGIDENQRANYPRPYEQVGIAKPGSKMGDAIARRQNAPVGPTN